MVSTKFIATSLLAATASADEICNPLDTTKLLTGLSALVGDLVVGLEGSLASDVDFVNTIVGELKNATGAIDVGCLLSDVGELTGDVLGLLTGILGTVGKLL